MPSEPTRPSASALKKLFALSGNRCAFPGCTCRMVEDGVLLGEVCHMAAAKPEGPRYDPSQTGQQRHAYENLILLCPTHHAFIDSDPNTYTMERLRKMKTDHEAIATAVPETQAEQAAQLALSINQSGGITAQTIHTINYLPPREQPTVARSLPVTAGMEFVGMRDVLASVDGRQNLTFEAERFGYAYLKAAPNQQPVGLPRVLEVFRQARPHPFSTNLGGTFVRNRHGAIFFNLARGDTIEAFTQGFASGGLYGANGNLFQFHRIQHGEHVTERYVLPAVMMEQVYATALPSYAEVASRDFHMALPYEIELGASGLQDAFVGFPGRIDGHLEGPIFEEGFRRIYPLHEPSPAAVMDLLGRYFTDFYAHLLGIKRSKVIPQSAINTYQLPPLQPDA